MKKVSKSIHSLLVYLFLLYRKILFTINPKLAANFIYRWAFGRNINWKNPEELNEKLFWILFNTNTSLWTRLADKVLVKEYVKEKGLAYLLPKSYAIYQRPKDIDFSNLPNQFVIKTNNASGTVLIVRDKQTLDNKSTIKLLTKWLNTDISRYGAELHYAKIVPCILVEELLSYKESDQSMIDYKFFCFYGKPECIEVMCGRNLQLHKYDTALYDVSWNNISDKLKPNRINKDINVPCPSTYEQMVNACNILARDIPFVRIDFYDVDGKLYFGEMTFTPGFNDIGKPYYEYLGTKLDISQLKK